MIDLTFLTDSYSKPLSIRDFCERIGQKFEILPSSITSQTLSDLLLTDLQAKIVCPFKIPFEGSSCAIEGPGGFPETARIIANVLYIVHTFKKCMPSEDNYHTYWDEVIWHMLAILSTYVPEVDLRHSRNATDWHNTGTLQGNLRPDFLCYMKRALVLRGEEKGDSKIFYIARTELAQKFGTWSPMFYGQLPFVLGYAAAGFEIK